MGQGRAAETDDKGVDMYRMTVLIAEDNDWHRAQLARMLRARDYDVVTVRDADELTRALTIGTPDAIFVDLFLPGMSALTLAHRMSVSGCPVPLTVLVSNRTEASITRRSLPAAAILNRPFEERELLHCLNDMQCHWGATNVPMTCLASIAD